MLYPGERESSRLRPVSRTATALVVVDGSDKGWRALSWAVGYAQRGGCSLEALTLLQDGASRWCEASPEVQWGNVVLCDPLASHGELSASTRDVTDGTGVPVGIHPRPCRTWNEIVQQIRVSRPDLVVLGAHGPMSRFVSRRLRKAGVPVTLIP